MTVSILALSLNSHLGGRDWVKQFTYGFHLVGNLSHDGVDPIGLSLTSVPDISTIWPGPQERFPLREEASGVISDPLSGTNRWGRRNWGGWEIRLRSTSRETSRPSKTVLPTSPFDSDPTRRAIYSHATTFVATQSTSIAMWGSDRIAYLAPHIAALPHRPDIRPKKGLFQIGPPCIIQTTPDGARTKTTRNGRPS